MSQRMGGLFLSLLLGLGLALAACAGASTADNQAATATALAEKLGGGEETATNGQSDVTSVLATLAPEDTLIAAGATATAFAVELEATRVAGSAVAAGDAAATLAAQAPIREELVTYGVDPAVGALGWVHPPEVLDVQGYMGYTYTNRFLATVAQDFVIAADITWNTQFGTTGCGFVVRTDGNEEALNQYIVIITRGAQGYAGFVTMIDGEVDTDQSEAVYANGIDPLFEWQNDTTNRLAVVGQGNTFTIYTNGTQIGQFTPQTMYEKGFVAFVALNESGYTRCQFDNAWLWLLN